MKGKKYKNILLLIIKGNSFIIPCLFILIFLSCDRENVSTEDELLESLIPVPFYQVNLEDRFWKPRLEVQKNILLPFALEKVRPAVENLERAGQYLRGDSTDLPFPHRYVSSDLYKVLEGASYLLMDHRDPVMEERIDSIVRVIAEAQTDDGYLYVAHITGVSQGHDHWGGGGMGDRPYSFVLHSHELYNMGHMYEAAIAYFQATGKDQWLKVAEKNAKHINRVFFEGDPDYNGGKPVNQAPGHEELELALVKLFRVTGDSLYLNMARKFLDIRGVTFIPEGEQYMSSTYAQQHKPVDLQRKAVGHAVRAAYLYSGMADVGSLLIEEKYDSALISIWHDIVDRKMPITGGLGAIQGIEGFGNDYELPNKEGHNETCAAVGNVLFNYRMFLKTHNAKFMDVAEVALYNNVLAGVSLSGDEFFYVNPLEADGVTPFNHGEPGRSPWFETACCPSNMARLLPQISGMMYAHGENEIYTLLYASNTTRIPLQKGVVELKQETSYPFDEKCQIKILLNHPQAFTLSLRIPTWAYADRFVPGELYKYVSKQDQPECQIRINGNKYDFKIDRGFARINKKWESGDIVELTLPMPVQFNTANEKIEANKDRLAITRGPLVYCAEGIDNEGSVQNLLVKFENDEDRILVEPIMKGILKDISGIQIPMVKMNGLKEKEIAGNFIPYYAWNNRDDGSMIVWLKTR